MRLTPTQIHTQYHLGPVLCLGTTGTGLDVDEGVAAIGLTGEHAPELQVGDPLFHSAELVGDLGHGLLVVLLACHFDQFGRLVDPATDLIENVDDLFQGRSLTPQCLGPFGLIPDVGLFEFADDFGQAITLLSVVKGTPSGLRNALGGHRSGARRD